MVSIGYKTILAAEFMQGNVFDPFVVNNVFGEVLNLFLRLHFYFYLEIA